MLDENLPTFYLKPSPDHVKYHQSFYLTYRGSEPEPAYNLKHPDPASPAGKNCYAAALFDSFNPEILYGEVLVRPEWTTSSVSQDEIRRNGGVAPPPQPILPQEFVIQLYNPDQQVIVKQQKAGGWGGAPTYTFSMPQQTFRLPSNSALDRQLSDPAADITTPQVNFVWKRDGKLSKDLACYMTGKSTEIVKKKHKEPDIIVSIFQALREVTIYESNYQRIDIEDPKGLEVVLLLCAAVLKDVYFAPIREAFNVGDAPPQALRKHSSSLNMLNNGMQRKPSPKQSVGLLTAPNAGPALNTPPPPMHNINRPASRPAHATPSRSSQSRNDRRRQSLPQLRTTSTPNMPASRPPPADPRSQWEIDAETARLKAQQETERRARDERRREQERADAAEAKRLKKQLDAEEKERRRKQAEVDKETERLRKKYGTAGQAIAPAVPPRHASTPRPQALPQQRHHQSYPQLRPQQHPMQAPRPPPPQHHHHQGPPTMSGGAGPSGSRVGQSSSFLASNGLPIRNGYVKPKRSFWGLGSSRDMDMGQNRSMARKSSVMF